MLFVGLTALVIMIVISMAILTPKSTFESVSSSTASLTLSPTSSAPLTFADIAGDYYCWGDEVGHSGGPYADSGSIALYADGTIESIGKGQMVWTSKTDIKVIGDIDILMITLYGDHSLGATIRPEKHRTHSGKGWIGCKRRIPPTITPTRTPTRTLSADKAGTATAIGTWVAQCRLTLSIVECELTRERRLGTRTPDKTIVMHLTTQFAPRPTRTIPPTATATGTPSK
jgi:hypothetical protein